MYPPQPHLNILSSYVTIGSITNISCHYNYILITDHSLQEVPNTSENHNMCLRSYHPFFHQIPWVLDFNRDFSMFFSLSTKIFLGFHSSMGRNGRAPAARLLPVRRWMGKRCHLLTSLRLWTPARSGGGEWWRLVVASGDDHLGLFCSCYCLVILI